MLIITKLVSMVSFLILSVLPILALAQSSDEKNIQQILPTIRTWTELGLGVLGTSLVFAHLCSPNEYSWKTNTISELGSQNYQHAWIMRSGFLGGATLFALGAVSDLMRNQPHWSTSVPLLFYGTSLALTKYR